MRAYSKKELTVNEIEINDCTPSLSQACRFKKLSLNNELTSDIISNTMCEDKANQREMFKLPMERIKAVAPKIKNNQLEDFVLKACAYYSKVLARQRDRDSR